MAMLSKSEVLKRIKKDYRSSGGKVYETFIIYFGTDEDGKKIRTTKPSMQAARLYVDEYFRSLDMNGRMMAVLRPADVVDAREALDILAAAELGDMSLRACARMAAEQSAGKVPEREAVPLGKAYDGYLAGIPAIQGHHRKCVARRVGRWAAAFGRDRDIADVTARDVAEYVAACGNAVKTRNNALNYIKSFLNWCAREERGLVARNPCAGLKHEREAYRDPLFIPVPDMERLAREVEANFPAAIPFLVLSYWCGIRSDEIERLMESPSDINWEEGSVRVARPKGWTKGIRPRVVHIEPNAAAWMRRHDIRTAIAGNGRTVDSIRAMLQKAAKRAGVEIHHNYGRHSYITYLSAKTGNPSLAETMAGTSRGMRMKHYDGLATRAAGEAYFSIMPSGG